MPRIFAFLLASLVLIRLAALFSRLAISRPSPDVALTVIVIGLV